jgi:hypothetical protein
MVLVDHLHGGAVPGAVGMATTVQQDILKKRFKGIMSKLQTEGTRSKSGVDM